MGKGVDKNERKAFDLFTIAAKKGNPVAQVGVGESYENGRGVVRNPKMADTCTTSRVFKDSRGRSKRLKIISMKRSN